MQRIYSTETNNNEIKFFVGEEIEHSPAFGLRTLFVVGLQPTKKIQQVLNASKDTDQCIQHIYFGANQSFPLLNYDQDEQWKDWEKMIEFFLEQNYWCTLDLDISCIIGLAEGSLCEHRQFIPMISAKIPYIQLLGYNATLKIDVPEFAKSNPGVWCHSMHDLMDRKKFTSWNQYSSDEVIG